MPIRNLSFYRALSCLRGPGRQRRRSIVGYATVGCVCLSVYLCVWKRLTPIDEYEKLFFVARSRRDAVKETRNKHAAHRSADAHGRKKSRFSCLL